MQTADIVPSDIVPSDIVSTDIVPTVRASQLKQDHHGIHFHVESPWGAGQVNSPLLGRFNVSNLLAVVVGMFWFFRHADHFIYPISRWSGRITLFRTAHG